MFLVVAWLSCAIPTVGPQLVRPGMPHYVARALIGETPNILSRTNNRIRGVEYLRAGLKLALDDRGRIVSVNGEEITAEDELERIVKALPEGFKRAGFRPILRSGENPDKDSEIFGYARIRAAKMTSDTTAKITLSFYFKGKDGEEEYRTLFVFLSWYRDWWTVAKYEGDSGSEEKQNKLTAYLDEVSAHRP